MKRHLVMCGALALALTACPKKDEPATESEPLTLGEASEALTESSSDSQASSLTASSVEISTGFTLKKGVEAAASEVASFVEANLPCAEVQVAKNKLSIEYGKKAGSCVYRGQTFKGKHTISVERAEDDVLVKHEWVGFTNGIVEVNGHADVTWSFDDPSRTVDHELTWKRLKDGKTGVGSGKRTQRPLDGDLTRGIEVDGSRSWKGEKGTWDLAISKVRWRWGDPVPESGSYTLSTPAQKTLGLSFTRVDGDTIKVTITGGRQPFTFNVNKIGDSSS